MKFPAAALVVSSIQIRFLTAIKSFVDIDMFIGIARLELVFDICKLHCIKATFFLVSSKTNSFCAMSSLYDKEKMFKGLRANHFIVTTKRSRHSPCTIFSLGELFSVILDISPLSKLCAAA